MILGLLAKRRDQIIKEHIARLISSGADTADAPNLYFESAFGFAKAHGAQFDEWEKPDIVFVFKPFEVSGQNVSVWFERLPGGGTRIGLD